MKKYIAKLSIFSTWLLALCVRKSIKLTMLFGVPNFIFVTPVLGAFFSVPTTCGAYAVLWFIKFIFTSLPITLGIPTLLSMLSWSAHRASQTRFSQFLDITLHIIFPLTCIGLFVTNPVGAHASAYAMYWLIPIAICILRKTTDYSSSLMCALASTFVAHAAGSVIWLLTMPTTPTFWLGLIPVVAIERLTIAGASALVYEAIQYAHTKIFFKQHLHSHLKSRFGN